MSPLITILICIAILCVIASVIIKLLPMPEPVPTVLWAIIAVACLLMLLRVVPGLRLP